MNYEVIATDPFKRQLKKLAKKYRSLPKDLSPIVDELAGNPTMGTSIGKDCYKIRLALKSKGKGKSGGARIITFVRFVNETVFLLGIYDKSEQDTLSNVEIRLLIEMLTEE